MVQEVSRYQCTVEGQLGMGRMYSHAHGVERDEVTAYMWFNLAAASGNVYAQRSREDAARRLSPEQVSEAQKRSREWKPGGM